MQQTEEKLIEIYNQQTQQCHDLAYKLGIGVIFGLTVSEHGIATAMRLLEETQKKEVEN